MRPGCRPYGRSARYAEGEAGAVPIFARSWEWDVVPACLRGTCRCASEFLSGPARMLRVSKGELVSREADMVMLEILLGEALGFDLSRDWDKWFEMVESREGEQHEA